MGRVFRPNSTISVSTLVSRHDTDMEDNMDWEAEWNELANKAWVSEAQLAGSTQITVQDFRTGYIYYTERATMCPPYIPFFRVYSRS